LKISYQSEIRDKASLQYISECKLHLTSQFCKLELGLKST